MTSESGHGYKPGAVIVLTEPNAEWPWLFDSEASAIRRALTDLPIELHHIGSTAIPGIVAKPVIDMLGVVWSVDALDANARRITALGYEAMG